MKTQAPPVGMESSFVAHLQHTQPELLPGRGMAGQHAQVAHGTTIVALTFADGVVMAGDRRATVGNMIASSHMEKVFAADSHSVIGVSGSAGLAVDMARLFAVELEHYEKIEGTELSLMGKSNRLAALVRAQLPYLAQGLVAIPLFAGVDKDTGTNKIFSFDVTGGRFEEYHHHSVGSGSPFARGSLKKIWRAGATRVQAISMALRALQDAAEEDSATSGPDPRRGLWPVVWSVTGEGVQRVPESEIATLGQESWAELT